VWGAKIDGAFEFARVDEIDDVIAVDVPVTRQYMDRETFSRRDGGWI